MLSVGNFWMSAIKYWSSENSWALLLSNSKNKALNWGRNWLSKCRPSERKLWCNNTQLIITKDTSEEQKRRVLTHQHRLLLVLKKDKSQGEENLQLWENKLKFWRKTWKKDKVVINWAIRWASYRKRCFSYKKNCRQKRKNWIIQARDASQIVSIQATTIEINEHPENKNRIKQQ